MILRLVVATVSVLSLDYSPCKNKKLHSLKKEAILWVVKRNNIMKYNQTLTDFDPSIENEEVMGPVGFVNPEIRRFETIQKVVNENMVRLPRKEDDRRVRTFSEMEITMVVELYKAKKSRRHIARLFDCSYAPITRVLKENGLWKL